MLFFYFVIFFLYLFYKLNTTTRLQINALSLFKRLTEYGQEIGVSVCYLHSRLLVKGNIGSESVYLLDDFEYEFVQASFRAPISDLASNKLNSRACLVLGVIGLRCGNCLDVVELKEVWKTVSSRKRPSCARRLHIVRLEATIHLSCMLYILTKS